MTLSEFLMYCQLKGLVTRRTVCENGQVKVAIKTENDAVYMLYSGDEIIKSEMHRSGGKTSGTNFPLSMIVEAILCNDYATV